MAKRARPKREESPTAPDAERLWKRFVGYVDRVDCLTRAVAAPTRDAGYGGLEALLDGRDPRSVRLVRGQVEMIVERLQAWIPVLKEVERAAKAAARSVGRD